MTETEKSETVTILECEQCGTQVGTLYDNEKGELACISCLEHPGEIDGSEG